MQDEAAFIVRLCPFFIMKYFLRIFLLLIFSVPVTYAQSSHSIKGIVTDRRQQVPLPYALVQIYGTDKGCYADSTGHFLIKDVKPGIYSLQISLLGYTTLVTPEYILSTGDITVDAELESSSMELQEVNVTVSPFRRVAESPTGRYTIGLQEIEKSPGANRDISRIVQSYPGVAFSPIGYRNDLIVRGGGPSENRFYIDGIEIPIVNHFSTEGASGGPVGIIDADLIREVDFYTGAFPAGKGNALSSVLDFRLRDGYMDRNSVKATLGYSNVSLAANGHIGEKTSYLVSVRQSYLQFLFKVLGLPFLPTFTDAQFKIKTRFDKHHELTILGLGGIDDMKLNTDEEGEDAEYILSYLPKIQQNMFTVGGVYKHYAGSNVQSVVASHSFLQNKNTKYRGNDESSPENLSLRLRSTEQETKLRFENLYMTGKWKINAGVNFDYSQYDNSSFQKVFTDAGHTYDYRTSLGMVRWGFFGTASYETGRLSASLGIRGDACNFSKGMQHLYKQLSPRLALSWRVAGDIYLSANIGRYYQLPPYTALGFKDSGQLANKGLEYMRSDQAGAGISYQVNSSLQLSAEGFFKKYGNIPLSVNDGIPLMCKGNDYGVIGNEPLVSTAEGRAYGAELMMKWVVTGKFNVAASFTVFKSEYRNDKSSAYVASAWDNRFIFNASGTYNFPKNWSVGAKVSCIGGAPYTPYDAGKSSLIAAWDAQGRPYYDYSRYNSMRLSPYGQLDIRVDKSFYFKKCMLGFYIDLQNVTKSKLRQQDILMSTGQIDPQNPDRYVMKTIRQESGTLLPTIGITFEI